MSEYEDLAKTVLRKSLHVKAGENVIVETWNHGLPVATEFVHQARAIGARPMLLFEDEGAFWRSAAELPKGKVGHVGGHEWKALEAADAYVFLPGPADITRVHEVGEDRFYAAIGYNDEWYKRAKRYRIRGARIGLGYATPERAVSYGLDLDGWRRTVLEASAVDPREIRRAGRALHAALSKKGRLEITAGNGTRFACELSGRMAAFEDAEVTEEDVDRGSNMADVPAGEVYVCPDAASGEGTIRFDRPIPATGRWIRDIAFTFEDGRAKWTAAGDVTSLQRTWQKAKGPKDRLAYVDVGLNPKARLGFLGDAMVAGVVSVGIGANAGLGGKNKTDFYLGGTLTGATVTIGGKTVVEGGRIVA